MRKLQQKQEWFNMLVYLKKLFLFLKRKKYGLNQHFLLKYSKK